MKTFWMPPAALVGTLILMGTHTMTYYLGFLRQGSDSVTITAIAGFVILVYIYTWTRITAYSEPFRDSDVWCELPYPFRLRAAIYAACVLAPWTIVQVAGIAVISLKLIFNAKAIRLPHQAVEDWWLAVHRHYSESVSNAARAWLETGLPRAVVDRIMRRRRRGRGAMVTPSMSAPPFPSTATGTGFVPWSIAVVVVFCSASFTLGWYLHEKRENFFHAPAASAEKRSNAARDGHKKMEATKERAGPEIRFQVEYKPSSP